MTYDTIGLGYNTKRHADPQIAARLAEALSHAKSILNVGAGTGSYEPAHHNLIAVEPSTVMLAQRPRNAAPAVQAVAEALPFLNAQFDAAMAVLTVHHWKNIPAGLDELRRVVSDKIIILTWDPECDEQFWLTRDYLPEILAFDRVRFPTLALLKRHLGPLRVEPLLIPATCTDGFRCAYWKRPHAYLDPAVQKSISSFAQADPAIISRAMAELANDLDSGRWIERNGDLKAKEALDAGYRLIQTR